MPPPPKLAIDRRRRKKLNSEEGSSKSAATEVQTSQEGSEEEELEIIGRKHDDASKHGGGNHATGPDSDDGEGPGHVQPPPRSARKAPTLPDNDDVPSEEEVSSNEAPEPKRRIRKTVAKADEEIVDTSDDQKPLEDVTPKRAERQTKVGSARRGRPPKNGRKKTALRVPKLFSSDDDAESYEGEIDAGDDDEDFDEEDDEHAPSRKLGAPKTTSKKTPPKAAPRKRGRTRKEKDHFIASSDSDDLAEHTESSNDEDEIRQSKLALPRERKMLKHVDAYSTKEGKSRSNEPTLSRTSRQRRGASSVIITYAEIDHSDIDVEDAEIGNTPPKSKRYTPKQSSNEEEDVPPKRRKPVSRRSSRRAADRRTVASSEDDELDDVPLVKLSRPSEEDVSPTNRRGTPGRRSAQRAKLMLAAANSSSDGEENYDDIPMLAKRKSKKNEDDDEFDEVRGSDEDDEEIEAYYTDDDYGDYGGDDYRKTPKQRRKAETANVDDEDIFDADESSEGEGKKPAALYSPMLDIRTTPRKSRLESSDANEEEEDDEPEFHSPRMPICTSTHDAITMEELPKRHVCFQFPDGNSRQCFALETLHKIAFSNNPCTDEEGKITFKQPPHFREGMSDDLVDQIASRFGRSALDLRGEFYNREDAESDDDTGTRRHNEFAYMVNFDGTLADNSRFNEMVEQYLSRYMGSKDIYCCPVCYAESYRRLSFGGEKGFDPDDDSKRAVGDTNTDFLDHDPISVLGSLDNEMYKLASSFCFRKLADVKKHLREDHNLDTKNVSGNDLYKRFQIRAPDGLLQRHLDRRFKGRPKQGYMIMYWNEGNSDIFIYLLHLLERSKLLREEAKAGNESSRGYTEAAEFVEITDLFWDSFESRASRMWELLASPYKKGTEEDMKDFFADDDEEVDETPHSVHVNAMLSQDQSHSYTPEEEIVAALKAKRSAHQGMVDEDSDPEEEEEPSDSDRSEEEELDEGDEEDDVYAGAYYSEEEEEDDPWMKDKLSKRKTKDRTPKPLGKTIGLKKLGGRKKSSVTSSQASSTVATDSVDLLSEQSTSNQKRRRIADSDDDD